jgi:light-regulated signal transduction histidine kinase (bacteriophytochrome)
MTATGIRFGEADLSTCDREPIHIPGSIQPHGILLVLNRGTGVVEQTAGDPRFLLGVDSSRLLGFSLASVLEPEAVAFVDQRLSVGAAVVAPSVRLGVRSRSGALPLDITVHADQSTAVIELEPARRTATSAGDPISLLKSLLAAVQATASVDESCAAAASAFRAATGFDRAMVYRFLPDDSGVVVAEDARSELESYLGLHYPASDIPAQARELYRRNWLRVIPDIDYVPAPLVPSINPRLAEPIDMSHCSLRSVSPIHVEYLRNMGVSASLSASIICQDRLWGMLVMHNYSPRHVSADLRVACETFAQVFSLHVEAKMQAETSVLRLEARRVREELVGRLNGVVDIGAVIADWDVLSYVGATGAAVMLDGAMHCVGVTPPAAEVRALATWLNSINQPLFATDRLASEYEPAAAYPAIASGLLAVGLSRDPRDYVLWFRPEIGQTVRWAGDPSSSIKTGPLGSRLTPRGSFKEWLEVTRLTSAAWSLVDLEAAEALRVVLLECLLRMVDLARREQAFQETRAMADELEHRVEQRTEQLRRLATDLEAAEERERRQIASDLHDDLGQTLAAARIRLAALCGSERADVRAMADAVGVLIDQATQSTRSLATQLAPAVLHELGLAPALDVLGEEIGRTFGLRVTVTDDGLPKPLSHEMRSILYRAVRELLINVAKHAKTDVARVDSVARAGAVRIRVSDAGVGYDPSTVVSTARRGQGLVTLRERLSLVGGKIEVQTVPGTGTVTLLTAPLAASDPPPTERRR